MPPGIKSARRKQSQAMLDRLRRGFTEWLKSRTAQDRQRLQFSTPLAALDAEITGALRAIQEQVCAINLQLSAGAVYAACARCERLLGWLWGVFGYFRERFDQRDDPELAPTLFAADEVIWSCYSPILPAALSRSGREPSPLPCIAGEMSPAAIRRDRAPLSLIKEGTDFAPLRDYLDRLPISILRLPRTILEAPWMLILIGHEAGHFAQPLVQSGGGYELEFRREIEAAITGAGGTKEEAADWGGWAPEIFADWYSVLTMGPWAAWMMAQLELADETAMLIRRRNYPPRIVRLALLAALADGTTPSQAAALLLETGIDLNRANSTEGIRRALEQVAPLAAAIRVSKLGGVESLGATVGFRPADYSPNQEVERWSRDLLGVDPRPPVKSVRSARLIAAAAGAAYAQLMHIEGATERNPAEEELAKTAEKIRASAPEGRRAATAVAAPEPDAGLGLVEVIAALDAETGELTEVVETFTPDA
jgi:hypothetical protein